MMIVCWLNVVLAAQGQSISPVAQGAPELSETFNMAKYVDENHGMLPFDFAIQYLQGGSKYYRSWLWRWGEAGDGGHAYLAVTSAGYTNLTAMQAMRICKDHIGSIFPGGAVEEGADHTKIELNRTYRLHVPYGAFLLGGPFDRSVRNGVAVVKCTDVSPLHFTFSTTDQHTLQGTALHGVFKDKSGTLYMYQQGRGYAKESFWAKSKTYIAANTLDMWRSMASNLSKQINLKN